MRKGVWSSAFISIIVLLIGVTTSERVGHAQELQNRWRFGSDIGFISGTTNGTVFSLGLNLDYYFDRAFSVGPMLLLAPVGDLTQIMMAGVARYHFRTGPINIVPFAGLGLAHADLDKGNGPGRIDKNDTSHYIPLGISAEYQVSPKLALASSLIINLHDLNLDAPVGRDRTSVALMFGMRFGP
jgi:hypothetical protein